MKDLDEIVDVAVIGAGVVGLSTACAVASRHHSTCIVELEARPGLAASTHNSGVIHSGIYYKPKSQKAVLCVEGKERLYSFCREHEIPHERCGKLIVASETADVGKLEALMTLGRHNGLTDLEIVDRRFVRKREPYVEAKAAIWSPSTGIVETESFVRTLFQHAIRNGVATLLNTRLQTGTAENTFVVINTERETFGARVVINAAGLFADEVSQSLGGDNITIWPVRGNYAEFVPSARHLVRGLVYPLPDPTGHGLGVHATRTTRGNVTLGPTAYVQNSKHDYESDRESLSTFYDAAKAYIPSLTPDQLRPGSSGIRARGGPPGQKFSDFRVERDSQVPHLLHAAGIDSPGLTASLAIAELLADLVDETLL